MILAATSHGPDPLNAFAKLYETSQKGDIFTKQPCMNTNLLRCYLVLHDCAHFGSDMTRSLAVLNEVRKTYGVHCALLPIHSASDVSEDAMAFFAAARDVTDSRGSSASLSVPLGANLSMDDVQRLRVYVRELITKSLVPFLESTVQHLSEQVAAQRKGLTGRLLGASRKFFTGRSATASSGTHTPQDLYPATSTAAQTRRLADWAMHIRDYRLAMQMYEAVRRDYQADQATWYCAFAADMICLSRLLYSAMTRSSAGSLEPLFLAACEEFSVSQAGSWFALRAAVLYAQLQQGAGAHHSAAMAYLRAADLSDELVRALLLEQASWAYLRMSRPHTRRSAGALLRAASQYRSCGQGALALNAFVRLQAYYASRHEPLQEYTRFQKSILYHTLGSMDEALEHLVPLLHGSSPNVDASRLQALVHLAEAASKSMVSLPTPLFQTQETRIVPLDPTDNVPKVVVQECFHVQLPVVNSFGVPLRLSDLQLHFVAHSTGAPLEADYTVDACEWAPYERACVQLDVSLHTEGMARLDHITYKLMDVLPVKQALTKRGPRLNQTPEQRRSVTYGQDTSLLIYVCQGIPRVQGTVEAPSQAMVGELLEVTVTLANRSAWPACDLSVVCAPDYLVHAPTLGAELALPWRMPRPSPFTLDRIDGHGSVPIRFHVPMVHVGVECLTWQIRYHNEQGESFTTRLAHDIHTRPALQAQVFSKPTSALQPQYHVAMEVVNLSDMSLQVTGLTFVSPQWHLSLDFEAVSLEAHHKAQWLARAQRHKGLDTLGTTVELLRPFFQGRSTNVSLPDLPLRVSQQGQGPFPSLLHWPLLYAAVRSTLRRHELSHWYGGLPISVQEATMPLMESHQIDGMVAWRTETGVVGETLVSGILLGFRDDAVTSLQALDSLLQDSASRAMYAETVKEKQLAREQLAQSPLVPIGCPISVVTGALSLSVSTYPHVAQLSLYVRNESPWPLLCVVRLVESSNQDAAMPCAPWLGQTWHRVLVPGWQAERVAVQALIDVPGTYRLGDWHIEAKLYQDDSLVRTFRTAGSLTRPLTACHPA